MTKKLTSKTNSAKARGKRKGVALVDTPPLVSSYTIHFDDPSREVAWNRFWDDVYALLLPSIIEQRSLRKTPAQQAA
jgi:hypothetical protein